MLTTAKITEAFAYLKENVDYSKYEEMEKRQYVLEDNLLTTFTPCPRGVGEDMAPKIYNIEAHRLKNMSDKQFYNLSLMDYLTCLTDVTFNRVRYEAGNLSTSSTRQIINSVRQIGEESVNGYAMKASYKDAKDLYILKAARNVANDELSHELACGLYATNRLRQYCPNYAYIYGGFRCSPPIIEDKEVKAFCTTKDRNGIQYVVYENINPDGKTVAMSEYVRTCTAQEFLSVYMQILYALKKGVEFCDFTHYDLHAGNVLIRPLPDGIEKAYIPYETEKKEIENLLCTKIATMIDFGYSHFKRKNDAFGIYGLQAYSVLPEVSFPLYDAYKLLMFSAANMDEANNTEAFAVAEKIFTFFNKKDEFMQALEDQTQYYYSIPHIENVYNTKLDALISYIRQNCDCSFIVKSGSEEEKVKSLVCGDECFTFDNIRKEVEAKGGKPTSLWALYDFLYNYYDEKMLQYYPSLLSKFEEEFLSKVEEGRRVVKILKDIIIDFSNVEEDNKILEYNDRFAKMVDYAILLKDIIISLETMYHIENKFVEIGMKKSAKMRKCKKEIIEFQTYRNSVVERVLDNNTSRIKKLSDKRSFNNALAKYNFI